MLATIATMLRTQGPDNVDTAGTAGAEPAPEAPSEDAWWNVGLEISGTKVTPVDLALAVVIVLAAFQVSRIAQRLAARGLQRAGIDKEGSVGTVVRLLHYGIMVLGLLLAISQLGIKLQTLLTAGAVFAVAFGFAMQDIAQNFVSGVILLIERTIKPGDVLEVEGRIVRVVDMGIRSTVARTRDEEEIIVPNSKLVQNTVKNFTLRDSVYRLRAVVGVAYGSDMGVVAQTLEDAARSIEWREQDRVPRIHLLEFGDSSVVWETSVWIQNPWMAPRLRSRLNQAVWWALKEKGITIAYPQMDLHLDPRVEGLLRSLSGGRDGSERPVEA